VPNENTVVFGRDIATRGSIRVDGVWPQFRLFYAARRDLSTGRVNDPAGREHDRAVIVNANDVQRADASLRRFNPFTETPQPGVHYRLADSFQQALEGDR
jgi:hypothetical protein